MNNQKTKFWVDVLMFISFLLVAVSGFVLWLVLPKGSGKSGSSFIILREDWIFIHDWGSVLLVVLLIIHLVLNWNWIKAMFLNYRKIK